MTNTKSYFALERRKNPIFWEVMGHYNTYEKAQEGLLYWLSGTFGPWRIVKETREIVQEVE